MPEKNPTQTSKYWAFISYSSRDETWARWLQRTLESYRIPRDLVGRPSPCGPLPKSPAPIFRDREELPASSNLGRELRQALRRSCFLIVICSPHAAASKWVNEEVREFVDVGGEGRILSVVVEGIPNARTDGEDTDRECLPRALRAPSGVSVEELKDPLWADARPGGEGRSLVRLKILAGLLGVGLDALRRREKRRRIRRATLFALGAVLAGTLWTIQWWTTTNVGMILVSSKPGSSLSVIHPETGRVAETRTLPDAHERSLAAGNYIFRIEARDALPVELPISVSRGQHLEVQAFLYDELFWRIPKSSQGPVFVTSGDFNADSLPDVAFVSGDGRLHLVEGFSGMTLNIFDISITKSPYHGYRVISLASVHDLDEDHYDELLLIDGSAEIRVLSSQTGSVVVRFTLPKEIRYAQWQDDLALDCKVHHFEVNRPLTGVSTEQGIVVYDLTAQRLVTQVIDPEYESDYVIHDIQSDGIPELVQIGPRKFAAYTFEGESIWRTDIGEPDEKYWSKAQVVFEELPSGRRIIVACLIVEVENHRFFGQRHLPTWSRILVLDQEDGRLLYSHNRAGVDEEEELLYSRIENGRLSVGLGVSGAGEGSMTAKVSVIEEAGKVVASISRVAGDVDGQTGTKILNSYFGSRGQGMAGILGTALDVDGDGHKEYVYHDTVLSDADLICSLAQSPSGVSGSFTRGRPVLDGSFPGILVSSTSDGQIALHDFSVPQVVLWRRPGRVIDVLPDGNSDGYSEILVHTEEGVAVYSGADGSLRWWFHLPQDYFEIRPVGLTDVNNDGELDIVLSNSKRNSRNYLSEFRLFAVSTLDGDLVWTTADPGLHREVVYHTLYRQPTPSLLGVDGVGSEVALWEFDRSATAWISTLPGYESENLSVLELADGTIIVTGNTYADDHRSFVVAFGAQDGSVLWRHTAPYSASGYEHVCIVGDGRGGELVLFAGIMGTVALAADTGEEIWTSDKAFLRRHFPKPLRRKDEHLVIIGDLNSTDVVRSSDGKTVFSIEREVRHGMLWEVGERWGAAFLLSRRESAHPTSDGDSVLVYQQQADDQQPALVRVFSVPRTQGGWSRLTHTFVDENGRQILTLLCNDESVEIQAGTLLD